MSGWERLGRWTALIAAVVLFAIALAWIERFAEAELMVRVYRTVLTALFAMWIGGKVLP